MKERGKELALFGSWLTSQRFIEPEAISILGEPVESVAILIRRHFPKATFRLVVENAKELQALGSRRELNGVSLHIGSDFGAVNDNVDLAILRIGGYEGKDRLRGRMISARKHLKAHGTLLVLTHTKRGASGQLAMLKEIFSEANVACRGGGGFRVLEGRLGTNQEWIEPEPDRGSVGTLKITEEILGEYFEFSSHASVFSKERVDPGSRLLLETLPPMSPRKILDFGCGYGVMGIVLARRHPGSRVTLVDVDAHAVELARANVALNGVEANTRVVLSDGLRQLPGERFDLAVIHFPLHIPRDELERLLTEIRTALEPGSCLYGVMLGVYELRPLVHRVFGDIETLKETREEETESAYSIVRACRW